MEEQLTRMIETTQMVDLDQTIWTTPIKNPMYFLYCVWWLIFIGVYGALIYRYFSTRSTEDVRFRNYQLDNALKLLTLRDGMRVLHPDIDASALDREIRAFPDIFVSGDFSPDESHSPSGREGALYMKFKSNMDAPPQDDYLPPIPPPPSLTRQTGISSYVV